MDKHLCPMQPDRQTDKTNYQQIRCALNRQIFTKKDKTSILNRRENHVVYFYFSAICSIIKSLTYNFYQRNYSINANVRPFVCMYVCLSVFLYIRLRGKRDSLGPYIRQSSHFFVCTFLLYMSIYSTYILSVGLSVRLQKAKELRYYGCCHPCWIINALQT